MTNPSETRDSELVAGLGLHDDSEPTLAGLTRIVRDGYLPDDYRSSARAAYDKLRESADTIDRLTSSGEAVGYVSHHGLIELQCGFSASIVAPEAADEQFNRPLYTHASPREGHVEVPLSVNTDAEWELEQRAFDAANHSDVPEWAQKTVADLWKQYCLATEANQGETKP